MSQYSVSVHFVALADGIRSGYVGGQLVITRNILSFFFHHDQLQCRQKSIAQGPERKK